MNWRDGVIDFIRQNALPVDKYDHQPRLYALTRIIGTDLTYDDDVVFAAAWLHDLGVFVGHRPEEPVALKNWDNVTYASQQAPAVLRQCGFPEAKIEAVVKAIRTHQPSGDPKNLESTLVRDADILEQLGAIAVVRAMAKIGRDTRYATYREVVPVLEHAARDLPAMVRLERARRLAFERAVALRAFLSSLAEETALPT